MRERGDEPTGIIGRAAAWILAVSEDTSRAVVHQQADLHVKGGPASVVDA